MQEMHNWKARALVHDHITVAPDCHTIKINIFILTLRDLSLRLDLGLNFDLSVNIMVLLSFMASPQHVVSLLVHAPHYILSLQPLIFPSTVSNTSLCFPSALLLLTFVHS